jgi:hypothetical protein
MCTYIHHTFSAIAIFTRTVWLNIKEWLGLYDVIRVCPMHEGLIVQDWWRSFVQKQGQSRRVMASLAMLV